MRDSIELWEVCFVVFVMVFMPLVLVGLMDSYFTNKKKAAWQQECLAVNLSQDQCDILWKVKKNSNDAANLAAFSAGLVGGMAGASSGRR